MLRDGTTQDPLSNDRSLQVRQGDHLRPYDHLPGGHYPPQPTGEDFDLREIWRKVRKRKLLILSIVVVVTTIVTIESFRNKSYYQAVAKIAFDQSKSEMKLGDLVLTSSDSERINTDLLMIKTYPLLEDVVVMLRLDQNPNFLSAGRRSVSESIYSIVTSFGTKIERSRNTLPTIDPVMVESMDSGQRSPQETARLAPFVQMLTAALNVQKVANT